MEDIDNGTTDNTDNGTVKETAPKSLPTGDNPNKSLEDGGESGKSLEEGKDPHKTLPTRDHETKKINEQDHETKANDEAYEEPKEEVKADLFNLDYFDKPEEAPPEVTEKADEVVNGDLNYFDNWIEETEEQKKQNKEQLEAYLKSNVESGNQLAYTQEDLTEAQQNLQNALDEFNSSRMNLSLGAPRRLENILSSGEFGNSTDRNEIKQKLAESGFEPASGLNPLFREEALNKWADTIANYNKQKQIQEDMGRNGPTANRGMSKAEEMDLIEKAANDYSSLNEAEKEKVDTAALHWRSFGGPNGLIPPPEPLNPLEPANSRNNRAITERNRENEERGRRLNNFLNERVDSILSEALGSTSSTPETPTTETPTTSTSEPARTDVPETPSTPETPAREETPETPASTTTEDDLGSAHEESTLAAMDLAEALRTSPSNIEDSDTARALQSGEFGNITSAEEMRRALIEDAGFPLDETTDAWARWAAARNRERLAESTSRETERSETPTETPTTETPAETGTEETPSETETESEEEGTESETPEAASSNEDVIAKADEAKAAYEEAKKREYEAIHREADETEIAQLAAEVERLRQEWEEAEAEAADLRPREDGETEPKEPRIGHGKEDRELSKEETLPEWVGGDDPHTSSAGAYWAGAFGDENWSDKVPQKTAQGLINYANDHHDNPFAMFGMTALMEAGGYDALKAGKDVQDIIAAAKEVTANANKAIDFFKNGSVKDGIKSILSAGWSVLKVLGNTLSAAWNVCKSAFSFLRSIFAPLSSAVSSFLNTVSGYNSVKAMIRDMYGIENTDEVIGEVFGDNSETATEQKPVNVLNKTGFSVKGGTVTDESGYNKGMKEKENEIASDVCKKTMLYFPYLRKSFR